MAGAYVGLGFPSKRQRKKELTKEKGYFRHPYFGGVFFQMNYKFHTTIATYASLFLRFEAGGAKYGGKPLDVEVSNKNKGLSNLLNSTESSGGPKMSVHGNLSLGIRLTLKNKY